MNFDSVEATMLRKGTFSLAPMAQPTMIAYANGLCRGGFLKRTTDADTDSQCTWYDYTLTAKGKRAVKKLAA